MGARVCIQFEWSFERKKEKIPRDYKFSSGWLSTPCNWPICLNVMTLLSLLDELKSGTRRENCTQLQDSMVCLCWNIGIFWESEMEEMMWSKLHGGLTPAIHSFINQPAKPHPHMHESLGECMVFALHIVVYYYFVVQLDGFIMLWGEKVKLCTVFNSWLTLSVWEHTFCV